MKKSIVYLLVGGIVLVGVIIGVIYSQKGGGSSDCSKYSNKDGYTGCMSIVNGKEKLCKFKVDNAINPSTQQMEFTYSCLSK